MRARKGSAFFVICLLMLVVAPNAIAQTFQFPDTALIVPWGGGAPTGGGPRDILGSNTFATTQINVVLSGQDVTFQIFTNYPLGGTTVVNGIFIPMADLAVDLDNNGVYEKAVVLTAHGTSPTFGQGLWNGVSWKTSNDLFASTVIEYGGKTVSPGDFIDVQISGGTFSSGLASPISTTLVDNTVTNGGNTETTHTRYDVDLGNVNTGGPGADWSHFSFLFGTGTCANDVLLGTVVRVAEPSTVLLLGLGLIGAARVRRRVEMYR